jgi:hypothetical protein
MSLVTCPDCRFRFSDESEGCPWCGYPSEKIEEAPWPWRRIFTFLLAGGAAVGSLFYPVGWIELILFAVAIGALAGPDSLRIIARHVKKVGKESAFRDPDRYFNQDRYTEILWEGKRPKEVTALPSNKRKQAVLPDQTETEEQEDSQTDDRNQENQEAADDEREYSIEAIWKDQLLQSETIWAGRAADMLISPQTVPGRLLHTVKVILRSLCTFLGKFDTYKNFNEILQDGELKVDPIEAAKGIGLLSESSIRDIEALRHVQDSIKFADEEDQTQIARSALGTYQTLLSDVQTNFIERMQKLAQEEPDKCELLRNYEGSNID